MTADLRALWDFDDPEGSEHRFRRLADESDEPLASYALSQVARALGLQGKYADGHRALEGLVPDDPESEVRRSLERGRLLRSSGDAEHAEPHFRLAADAARQAGLEELEVDALHMLALVAGPDERLRAHHEALERARVAVAQPARDWDASLLNNIGMVHADAGDHRAALDAFREALEARERIGDDARTRVARWMVAWSLRHLGAVEEARQMQLALKAELDELCEQDPYVDEELALLGHPSERR